MSAAPPRSTVRLVVDAAFGERLAELPSGDPVWIIDSEQNTPVAHRLWQASSPTDHLSITTFQPGTGLAADEDAIRMLDTVEEHHAGYSANPPYSVLEIIGCAASDRLSAALSEFGFRPAYSDSYVTRAIRENI